ncbi:hypothetical protein BSK59_14115 [Paenibacillus odorifer]|uniref:hypothetical protein n=1 Tax=Paenibacillus odorifer TaxID=189426 RepID=UPI00096DD2BC|nr:hypothetical protein [Paenibacillus odorifer]OME55603.1 hypothetical protein BSK59_14115 [Paenibacillus odorifer]
MKVTISIEDGAGKKANLEINDANNLTQIAIIQSVFDLFGLNTDFIEKEQQMSKIEKAYAHFFNSIDPLEPTKVKVDSQLIEEQMLEAYENKSDELIEAYKAQNDQPEFVKTGIKIRDGKPLYRLRYKCYACYDKSTLYVFESTKSIWCRRCNHELKVELATGNPFPSRDSFGNFFVAGDFRDWNV